jgi:hypothetical protein
MVIVAVTVGAVVDEPGAVAERLGAVVEQKFDAGRVVGHLEGTGGEHEPVTPAVRGDFDPVGQGQGVQLQAARPAWRRRRRAGALPRR